MVRPFVYSLITICLIIFAIAVNAETQSIADSDAQSTIVNSNSQNNYGGMGDLPSSIVGRNFVSCPETAWNAGVYGNQNDSGYGHNSNNVGVMFGIGGTFGGDGKCEQAQSTMNELNRAETQLLTTRNEMELLRNQRATIQNEMSEIKDCYEMHKKGLEAPNAGWAERCYKLTYHNAESFSQ